jgi:hypothetical protein
MRFKSVSKCKKKLEIFPSVRPDNLCSLTKFWGKKTFFVAYVRKTKKKSNEKLFWSTDNNYFYTSQEISFLHEV